MAQDFRNNLQRNVGTSEVTFNNWWNFDAVIGIRCCNVLTSTILVDVKIAKGGVMIIFLQKAWLSHQTLRLN